MTQFSPQYSGYEELQGHEHVTGSTRLETRVGRDRERFRMGRGGQGRIAGAASALLSGLEEGAMTVVNWGTRHPFVLLGTGLFGLGFWLGGFRRPRGSYFRQPS